MKSGVTGGAGGREPSCLALLGDGAETKEQHKMEHTDSRDCLLEERSEVENGVKTG